MDENRRPATIHDHKHRAVQTEIRRCAFELFVKQGFESTTVEQIAEAAGISRRTYFRYFETKEDVVIAALEMSGEFLEGLVRARPAEEAPVVAMQRAMVEFLTHYQTRNERAWDVLALIESTSRLRARFLLERDRWIPKLSKALEVRSSEPDEAEATAAASLGLLTIVYDRWHRNPESDAGEEVQSAFAAVERAFAKRQS